MEKEPEIFQEESYDYVGWAVLDTTTDCCYVCGDVIDIPLDRAKRYDRYFIIQYISDSINEIDHFSRFAEMEELIVEATAKLVNRPFNVLIISPKLFVFS